jgi:hypothetical protein
MLSLNSAVTTRRLRSFAVNYTFDNVVGLMLSCCGVVTDQRK